MNITRKEFIINKYNELKNKLNELDIDIDMDNTLDEDQLPNYLSYLEWIFNEPENYEINIKILLNTEGISYTENDFKIIYPIIVKYIEDIKKIL